MILNETILSITTTVVGMLASWFVARRYYFKNLDDQRKEFQSTLKEYRRIIEKFAEKENGNSEINKKLLEEKRIEQCMRKYVGTGGGEHLIKVIDTYSDLSNEEKADMLDTALLRARGRKAKNNPYREKDGK